jgi:adenylosuccinate synthase
LPGWQASIEKVTKYEELPEKCRAYVEFIEKFLGVPIEWIGVGPGRESMVRKEPGTTTAAA